MVKIDLLLPTFLLALPCSGVLSSNKSDWSNHVAAGFTKAIRLLDSQVSRYSRALEADSAAGWSCSGPFIKGKSRPCGEWDLGEMWECPFFVCLPHTAGEEPLLRLQEVLLPFDFSW